MIETQTLKLTKDTGKKLPDGWRWVRLLDIIDRITTGKLFDRESCKPEGKVPVIDQSESGFMGFHDEAPGIIASEDLPLVTFANHTCAIRLHTAPFSVIQNVFPLQVREGVDPYYVYWVLRGRLPATFYGGHWPKLVKKEIPLPPLPEQQRIAGVLREQMAAVEKARVAVQARLEAVKALPAAFLRQVFSQPGQPLPDSWRWVRLGDLCLFRRGPFGGSLRKEIFVETGYAVYEQGHAINNDFSKFRYYIDQVKFDEMRSFQVCPGELIMSCSGTMGKVAIIPENAPTGVINQALLRLTPTDHVFNTFLKVWMESENFQQSLADMTFGAAIKNVASVGVLKDLRVPLPPLPEQQRIAGVLKEQMAAVEEARTAAEAELAAINALPAALLRRAFAGEL